MSVALIVREPEKVIFRELSTCALGAIFQHGGFCRRARSVSDEGSPGPSLTCHPQSGPVPVTSLFLFAILVCQKIKNKKILCVITVYSS
jgi:hypothetical protein